MNITSQAPHLVSQAQYASVVQRAPAARGSHGQHGGGARRAGFEAAAEKIGTEPSELSKRIREGEALGSIAAEAGVGKSELKAVMTEAVKATAPPQVADRIVANLDDVIAGNRPNRPTGDTQDPSQALETLATTLDTDISKLMESVDDGSFRDLLAEKGVEPALGLLVNTTL